MAMKRTTIMADEEILERLRAIARRDRVSLGEVIRQALDWRARQTPKRRLAFIGTIEDDGFGDTSEWAGEAPYEPLSWR
jgi:predicted transcriptional regulator